MISRGVAVQKELAGLGRHEGTGRRQRGRLQAEGQFVGRGLSNNIPVAVDHLGNRKTSGAGRGKMLKFNRT